MTPTLVDHDFITLFLCSLKWFIQSQNKMTERLVPTQIYKDRRGSTIDDVSFITEQTENNKN